MTSVPAEQQYRELPVTAELMREALMSTIELPGADFRVLTYYMTRAPLGDAIRETGKDISQELGLHSGSFSKSIKRLRDGAWLELAYTVGKVSFYRVGPRLLESAAPVGEPEGQGLAQVHPFPIRPTFDGE
ncbi:MarR family transcriptional regulator [Streptomyces sp. G-5]|uniref:MarR family transcriptional regulator n=1 Tax=Streptomyces sp. G-5 TaxID=2977231 RepID=UPI0021D25020|nr:helix-turn-helix domain-containing protein [Streptomyces sp. G-5]MCU4750262.1 MarR family transcriptional regulator [Streptomyces sp. G-5]